MTDSRPRDAARALRARTSRGRRGILVIAAVVLVIAFLWAVASCGAGGADSQAGPTPAAEEVAAPAGPPAVTALPVPVHEAAAPPPAAGCAAPAIVDALAAGDEEGVVSGFGGGEAFRAAVAAGEAPCIDLSDSARDWLVVNKARPLVPIDFEPDPVVTPADIVIPDSARYYVRPAAAEDLSALSRAASESGVGTLGLNSAYRPYSFQERLHRDGVAGLGEEEGERLTLRPGYSEHQTGLAVDVVDCSGRCGSIEGFGSTALGAWVRENSWRYGWIIRYEDGMTEVTGIDSEPWHLRYIGRQLAATYHEGGWRSLEEFFGLPAAPGYP